MKNINGQMDVSDFLGGKPDSLPGPKRGKRTLFEQVFTKIDNPAIACANCLCQYCANNAEGTWEKARPEEMLAPCSNCDECRWYTGEPRGGSRLKEECGGFVISDYGAKRNRGKFSVKEAGKANGESCSGGSPLQRKRGRKMDAGAEGWRGKG